MTAQQEAHQIVFQYLTEGLSRAYGLLPPTAERRELTDQVCEHVERMLRRMRSPQTVESTHPRPLYVRPAPADPPVPAESPLTDREHQVLVHVAEGLSNTQIGAVLGLSPHTVNCHVRRILTTLEATTRAHAVAVAARAGLLPEHPEAAA